MHELGLVIHVGRILDDLSREEKISKIASVTLQIGEVSGVIPSYLTDCWRYFREKSELLRKAELKIEPVGAVTYCEECEKTYSTLEYKKICRYCGGDQTYLLTGNEFSIKEIEAC